MTIRLRVRPFGHPAERAGRLPWLVLAGLALLLLAVWNPLDAPGPVLCWLRRAVGLPCPLCGVTRGVALTLRGHPAEASAYNPLSAPVLFGGLALMAVWAFEYAANVRVTLELSRPWRWARAAAAVLALLGAWAYVLTYRREDDFARTWLGRALRLFW
jgi:hypothetical protein